MSSDICPWCELPLPLKTDDPVGVVIDHIIPRSRGGPNRTWNRQWMHRRCNMEKGSKLTPEAKALAEQHGIILHEPLPTAWPGSSVKLGSREPNPYLVAREAGNPVSSQVKPSPRPPKVKVTIRKVYEVECHTCGAIIDAPRSWDAAVEARHLHLADHQERSERLAG